MLVAGLNISGFCIFIKYSKHVSLCVKIAHVYFFPVGPGIIEDYIIFLNFSYNCELYLIFFTWLLKDLTWNRLHIVQDPLLKSKPRYTTN